MKKIPQITGRIINTLLTRLAVFALPPIAASCATYHTPAPQVVSSEPASLVRIVNDQPISGPRVFFSDGITTLTTDYDGWTNVIISKAHTQIASAALKPSGPKLLKISIASIHCTGHYVPDCHISLQIERGDGNRKMYSSGPSTAYPVVSALNKVIDESLRVAFADPSLIRYLAE
jgi:hypothetical protein